MTIEDILDHGGTGWAAVQPLRRTTQKKRNQDNLLHLLHVHVDSGLPPVVGVPGHAVVVVGVEYADQPQAQRAGRVISSSDFVKGLVVNDDNFAPYQRVPRVRPRRHTGVSYGALDADVLVVPLPEKVFLTAEKAETLITDLLEDYELPFPPSGRWSPGISKKKERFVRRLYCTSSKNYRTFRRRDTDSVSAELLRHPLPHFMWIGEFSPLSLWSKGGKHAVVEVALDATAGQYDSAPFLWIRSPSELVLNFERMYGTPVGDEKIAVYSVAEDEALLFSPFDGNLRRIS